MQLCVGRDVHRAILISRPSAMRPASSITCRPFRAIKSPVLWPENSIIANGPRNLSSPPASESGVAKDVLANMIRNVATKSRAAVIIPTHNRAESLPKTLDSILAQSVPADIYVMDDASTDQTPQRIPHDYPQVFYHREEHNRGPCYQRNKGARLAEAEIIFTIDDDCVLASPRTIEQTLTAFDLPRVAAVTVPFINVRENRNVLSAAPDARSVIATYLYYGGMAAFRRDVYLSVGGYRDFMFMHMEEPDLMIRLLAAGYIVRLGSADALEHFESPVRDNPRLHRLGPRNSVLYSFYNVPWPNFPVHLAGTSLACIRRGFQHGHPFMVVHGLGQGLAGIGHEWSRRQPVPREVYKLSRILKRRGEMPLAEMEPFLPPINRAGA
jgi:glycosyl transferase family 2